MTASRRWRLLRMALPTLLGGRRQGFFIPYRYADAVELDGARHEFPAVNALMRDARPGFARLLVMLDQYAEALLAIGAEPPPQPRWDQDWFPTLDAAVAYLTVRQQRPARIVEVGSGHSTRFLARAVRDSGHECRISAIDPAPRATLGGLGLDLHRVVVQSAPAALFAGLEAGDILFVDSSHILMPGSDVDHLLNRVIPGLPAGALLHIHDIFLPYGYPSDWTWRGYNEQNAVAAMLASGGWEVLFASHYAVRSSVEEVGQGVLARLPSVEGARPASLWLRKRG